jgi:hypothetical protein
VSVPFDQRWRLFATFNGGFIYRDGDNGSSIGGRELEPLKRGLATLVASRDGHVDVKRWDGGAVAGPDIAFARQSLPLIVETAASTRRSTTARSGATRWETPSASGGRAPGSTGTGT